MNVMPGAGDGGSEPPLYAELASWSPLFSPPSDHAEEAADLLALQRAVALAWRLVPFAATRGGRRTVQRVTSCRFFRCSSHPRRREGTALRSARVMAAVKK